MQDGLVVPEDASGRLAAETAAGGVGAVIVRKTSVSFIVRACWAAVPSACTRGGGTTVYTFVLDARVLLASVSKVRHWDLGTVSVKCQHRLGH